MYYFKEYIHGLIADLICNYKIHGPLLEVGCGEGENLVFFSKLGFSGMGLDLSAEALEAARLKLESQNGARFELFKKDLFSAEGRFGLVVAIDVIEHIDDDCKALQHLKSLLEPSAYLLVGVPSGPYMADDLGFGHFRRYGRGELTDKLAESGFDIEECMTVGYPFLHWARLAANRFAKLPQDSLSPRELEANTLKSDRGHPMKNTAFGQMLEASLAFPPSRLLIHSALKIQNLFHRHPTGHSLLALARARS